MNQLMNPNNPVYRRLNQFACCIILSLMWFLTSIPVVTIGAASTALYHAVHKVLREEEGYAWQEFLRGFRDNWKQATGIWLLMLVILALLAADIFVMMILFESKIWILFAIALALTLMWMQYVFPYVARIRDNTRVVLKNTLILSWMHLIPSILLLVVFTIAVASPFAFPYIIPFATMLFPALYTLLADWVLEQVFALHLNGDKS